MVSRAAAPRRAASRRSRLGCNNNNYYYYSLCNKNMYSWAKIKTKLLCCCLCGRSAPPGGQALRRCGLWGNDFGLWHVTTLGHVSSLLRLSAVLRHERDGIVEWGRVCAGSRVSYTAFHRSIQYAINEVLHSLIQNNKATKVRIGALLLFGDKWRLFCPVYSLPTF